MSSDLARMARDGKSGQMRGGGGNQKYSWNSKLGG